jgi:hypothetical protein
MQKLCTVLVGLPRTRNKTRCTLVPKLASNYFISRHMWGGNCGVLELWREEKIFTMKYAKPNYD